MAIVLAAALCLTWGYLIVASAWPRGRAMTPELLMKFFLSVGFGLGIFSVVFFVAQWLAITRVLIADSFVTAALLGLYLLRRYRSRRTDSIPFATAGLNRPRWLYRVLSASFILSILAALYSTVLRALAHPHGDGWDAFAIWNLHARFLFLGAGAHWRDGFSTLIPWSHPDYPLLVPAAIAHFWSYLGYDDAAVPTIIGLVFTFSTVGLLVASLAVLRGRTSAMLAGIALASTPFFVEQGASQYVDIPLSFFFLASIVLLHIDREYLSKPLSRQSPGWLFLAGIALGFAAWTKNEGLLFLFALLLAQVVVAAQKQRQAASDEKRDQPSVPLAPLLLAIAPALLLIACFKHFVAPPGDLFSNPSTMMHKLLSPARYGVIFRWYARELLRFGNWWIVPGTLALVPLYPLTSSGGFRQGDLEPRSSLLTIALTLTGYFAIYVITPNELYWHLRFSLNRLFLQLWPATIFLFFLFVGRERVAEVSN